MDFEKELLEQALPLSKYLISYRSLRYEIILSPSGDIVTCIEKHYSRVLKPKGR